MPKRILIHGADPILLDTRRRILSSKGFAVETVLNGAILAKLIQTKRPDLLVVCSSLAVDLQERDIRAANALRPRVKCLVVDPGFDTHPKLVQADTVLHGFDGPERFVTEVGKLISAP